MPMHDLGMPPVEQLQQPMALPWIQKKFPQPRTHMLSRVLPKLGSPNMFPYTDKPPYVVKWQHINKGARIDF